MIGLITGLITRSRADLRSGLSMDMTAQVAVVVIFSPFGCSGPQEVLGGIATFNRTAGVNQSKWQLKKDFQTK